MRDAPAAVLPSHDDPVVAGAAQAVGGPLGRHARLPPRRWSPARWVVVLTLLASALGFWQKAPCRVHAWAEEYQYTRLCYTDVLALYYSERLDAGATPYLEHPVEYPVLIGGAMAVAAGLADGLAVVQPGERVEAAERALGGADEPTAREAAQRELDAARVAARARSFFDVTWLLLTVGAVVTAVTTVRLAGRERPWDGALVALAPALVLHATTNWDLLATALAGLGLLAWARRRPVLAGVLLGLGTATKLYPLLLLVPLVALCVRTGRTRTGLRTALVAAVTAAAVTLPVYLVSPSYAEVDGAFVRVAGSPLERLPGEGPAALLPRTTAPAPDGSGSVEGVNAVYRFVQLNADRPADWDSLYFVLQRAGDELDAPLGPLLRGASRLLVGAPGEDGGAPPRLDLVVAVGTLLVLAAVVALALRAPRRPRVAQLAFLTVAGFLLVNKVFSPQYVLWLVPLAVLARPRWGPFLAWQATEALVLFTRFYFFVSLPMGEGDQPSEGIPVGWFLAAVVVRDLALVALAAAVVRDVLRPERDVVRRSGVDDPAGGVLDGAADAVRRPGGSAPDGSGGIAPDGPGGSAPDGPGGCAPDAPAGSRPDDSADAARTARA